MQWMYIMTIVVARSECTSLWLLQCGMIVRYNNCCSVRRNVEGLKESLEKVVVPIFCTAKMGAEEGAQTEKLDKVRF